MEWAELFSHWKELGTVGAVILILAKLGDKVFDRFLDWLGISIKRGQSREDDLAAQVKQLRLDVDTQGKRLTRIEGAYENAASLAHRAADGIEKALRAINLESLPISFFIEQLRTIQASEEVLKD